MSVIALDLVPASWSHKKIVAIVCSHLDRAHFQILAWGPSKKGGHHHRTIYFEIAKTLKPKSTLAKLVKMQGGPYYGFIPTVIPNNPKMKSRFLNREQKLALGIPVSTPKSFHLTLRSLMYELQVKYNGLYSLSAKYEHKLLEHITKVIQKRMTAIYSDDCDTALNFTQQYRKQHPHSTDLGMVQECLGLVQEEMGLPNCELGEGDLVQKEVHNDMGELKVACNTFANLITKEARQHISNLDTVCASNDSTEEIARKKMRMELQNIEPYLKEIMDQVIKNSFHKDLGASNNQKILLIGDPSLPKEPKLHKFLSRYEASRRQWSSTNYNMLEFVVPRNKTAEVMSMDSIVCAGARLLIRPADASPMYQIPSYIIDEINTFLDKRASI